MRAGKVVAEVDPRTQSDASLAQLMLGGEPPIIATRESPAGANGARNSTSQHSGPGSSDDLKDVSFDVRSGEIVGIAGISGNGQQTLMAALAGELLVEPDAIWFLVSRWVGWERRSGARWVCVMSPSSDWVTRLSAA